MKILLTGASGFLGKNLLDYHLGRRKPHLANSCLDRLAGRYEDVETHLLHRGEKPESFVGLAPDIIIHLAAEIKDPAKMYDSNVLLTWRLLEAFKDVPYKSFIYVGSSAEYGRNDKPMKEGDRADPTSMYEGTKAAATMLCQGHARQYKKPILIVRPFSIYGPHEPEKRLIPTLLRAGRTGEKMTLYPGVHDWLFVEDFLAGLWLFANTMPWCPGDIVNLGSGHQLENNDVRRAVRQVTRNDIDYSLATDFLCPYDSMHWKADITKARSEGWQPVHSMYEGLYRYARPESVSATAT